MIVRANVTPIESNENCLPSTYGKKKKHVLGSKLTVRLCSPLNTLSSIYLTDPIRPKECSSCVIMSLIIKEFSQLE